MVQELNLEQETHYKPNADISTTGVLTTVTVPRDRLVSVNIEATADVSYALDVAAPQQPESDDWFENEVTYNKADEVDPQDIRDTFILGDRYLRVRCTDPAANGDTADITIQVA